MNDRQKELLVIAVSFVILSSWYIIWSTTRASVPDDVRHKLNSGLIREIALGDWSTKHECLVSCGTEENMTTVINSLPSESIDNTHDSVGAFNAFLTPEQIFSIARMDEVGSILSYVYGTFD